MGWGELQYVAVNSKWFLLLLYVMHIDPCLENSKFSIIISYYMKWDNSNSQKSCEDSKSQFM